MRHLRQSCLISIEMSVIQCTFVTFAPYRMTRKFCRQKSPKTIPCGTCGFGEFRSTCTREILRPIKHSTKYNISGFTHASWAQGQLPTRVQSCSQLALCFKSAERLQVASVTKSMQKISTSKIMDQRRQLRMLRNHMR